MSEINDKTTIQLPTFDGDRGKHLLWDQQMMCYAVVKKFAQALGDAAEPDLPASYATVIDEMTDIGKRQAAAKQRNSIVMACLTREVPGLGGTLPVILPKYLWSFTYD